MERFNFKILNEVRDREQYHVKTSNRFAALENLHTEGDVNKAWETIRENIRMSRKRINPGSMKDAQNLLDQWKEAKLQWLQDPSEINGDNLNNTRSKPIRRFKNKIEVISERRNL
jgi:hypothetical protein